MIYVFIISLVFALIFLALLDVSQFTDWETFVSIVLAVAAIVAIISGSICLIGYIGQGEAANSLREDYYVLSTKVAIAKNLDDSPSGIVEKNDVAIQVAQYNAKYAQYRIEMSKPIWKYLFADKIEDLELIEYTYLPTP